MKRSEIINLPFNLSDNFSYLNTRDPKKGVKKSQYSAYQDFVKKRNAVRVDRYFIMLKSTRMKAAISVITIILIVTIVSIYIILSRKAFVTFSNDLTDTALFSSSEQIISSISFLIDEPHFFSSFIANFIHDAELPLPSKSTAYTYATYLTNANLASSKNIFWWKIGLPNGSIIGVFTNHSYENPIWYFADTNDHNSMSLYAYPTNSTTLKNESYPNEPGIYIREYNGTHRHWYQSALANNQTIWTNLYYSLTDDLPVFSSVTSSFSDIDDSVEYVVSLDLTLEHVQEYLRKMLPGRDSKFAITSSDGFVVAVAGFSPTIDEIIDFNGIITKSIKQLDDPVWQCVTKSSQFSTMNNFSVTCPVDDTDDSGSSPHVTYRVIRSKVNLADNYDWTIHIALKVDFFVQSGASIYNNTFIISSLVCLFVWIFFYFFQFALKKKLHAKETRHFMEKSKKKISQHVKQIGIPQGIEILQNVIASKDTDEKISIDINIAINQIRQDPDNFIFNKIKFKKSFTNPQVRDKILNIFGLSANDEDFDKENNSDISISTTNSALYNNMHKPQNDQETIENELEVNRNATFLDPSHKDPVKFSKFRLSSNIDYPSSINYIKNIGIELFQNSGLLTLINNDDEFVHFLLNEIRKIPPSLFCFCTDSFNFLELLLLNYKIQTIYYNNDIMVALFIALLSFHIAMDDRINENNSPIKRFFLIDMFRLSQIAHNLPNEILKSTKNEDNFALREKLDNILKYVDILISTVPISKHFEVMSRCQIFIPSTIQTFQPKRIESTLNDSIRFIYNTSTMSFIIGPTDFFYTNVNFLFSGFTNETEINNFIDCLNNVYLAKIHLTIKHIFGSSFHDSLYEK